LQQLGGLAPKALIIPTLSSPLPFQLPINTNSSQMDVDMKMLSLLLKIGETLTSLSVDILQISSATSSTATIATSDGHEMRTEIRRSGSVVWCSNLTSLTISKMVHQDDDYGYYDLFQCLPKLAH
jgi:hypothetical protein